MALRAILLLFTKPGYFLGRFYLEPNYWMYFLQRFDLEFNCWSYFLQRPSSELGFPSF